MGSARTVRTLRGRLLQAGIVLAVLLVLVFGPYAWLTLATRGRRYDDVASAPSRSVIIVFGAGLRGGSLSPFLRDRVDLAVELYRAGRGRALLMTGDNSRDDYDEVAAMRDHAVAAGVPVEAITLDHAGFSTYDSCFRARRIFGVRDALVVTQGYHLPRVVYTCRRLGVRAVGVAAADWSRYRKHMPRFQCRELLSAAKALWQLHVTHPEPHFLGPAEPIEAP